MRRLTPALRRIASPRAIASSRTIASPRIIASLFTITSLFAIASSLCAVTATAAPPSTVTLEGVLVTAASGPVADGAYDVTLRLYAAAVAGKALWTEVHKGAPVKGGRFVVLMGSQAPLTDTALGVDGGPWLAIQVSGEPALPRQRLRAAPFALRATWAAQSGSAKTAEKAKALSCSGCVDAAALASGSVTATKVGFTYAAAKTKGGPAADLACTGCVSVSELSFDDHIDLGKHGIKAATGLFSGVVSAATFVGDGSKLTGISGPQGDCGAGQVVVGIAADGTLKCANGATGDKVLGGMLTTEFTEKAALTKLPTAIPDNTGAEAVVTATFDDVGKANHIEVDISVANTDLSKLQIKLLPPDDKAKGLTVCDPCGAADAKSYKVTLTEKSKLKTGSLADYIGKPVKGSWTLKILDSAFCVPQKPGNATLCDSKGGTDGAALNYAVRADVTSSQSVGTEGTFRFGLKAKPPFACAAAKMGHAYFDTSLKKLRFCDGAVWRALSDSCGNGIIEAGEACDDGNNSDGDGCSATCVAGYGKGQAKPGKSCLDIRDQYVKDGGKASTGLFWLKPDGYGGGAFQAYCDMTTAGGGWTLVLRVSTHDSGVDFRVNGGGWTSGSYREVTDLSFTNLKSNKDHVSPAYASVKAEDVIVRERLGADLKHSVRTQDGPLGGVTLRSVLKQSNIDGGRKCSKKLAYGSGTPKHSGYDYLVFAGDESGDTEPARIALRNKCAGDAESLALGYSRSGHGNNEVYSQGNHWSGLSSVFVLVR